MFGPCVDNVQTMIKVFDQALQEQLGLDASTVEKAAKPVAARQLSRRSMVNAVTLCGRHVKFGQISFYLRPFSSGHWALFSNHSLSPQIQLLAWRDLLGLS